MKTTMKHTLLSAAVLLAALAGTAHAEKADFKVFGSLGMTVLFLVGQGIYLSRHLHDVAPTTPKTED